MEGRSAEACTVAWTAQLSRLADHASGTPFEEIVEVGFIE
jgi:hypothetical protein